MSVNIRWTKLLLWAALIPGAAYADQMHFDGANGAAFGGFYVSPYTATDQTLNHQIALYCLDFNHSIDFDQTWSADINTLEASNLSKFQYGGSTDFVVDPSDPAFDVFSRYKAAAWLFSQEGSAPGQRVLGVYQYAAWELFLEHSHQSEFNTALASIDSIDPVTNHTFQYDVDQALMAAQIGGNYNSTDLSQWRVVSPVPAGRTDSVQEFLTPVPEPSAILLLSSTILIGGFVAVRRRKSQRSTT